MTPPPAANPASKKTSADAAIGTGPSDPHVPADGGHPPVRRAGQRPLYARADARPRPSVYRRGSDRLRHLRSRCGATTTSPARTAATATAWPRARRPTACSRSCWARKPATARARAARCTSRIPDTGNLGANAIVGGSAGIATGAAFAAKYLKTGQVAVCFFGEGALGQGLLYEELNLAQLWKLPVIFVCENNGYNEYTHFSESTAGDVPARAAAFGMRARNDRRPERPRGLHRRVRRSSSARDAARARRSSSASRTAITATTSATSRGPTTGRRPKSRSGSPSAIPSRCTGSG